MLQVAVEGYFICKKSYLSQQSKKRAFDAVHTVFQWVKQDLLSCGYRGIRTRQSFFPIRWHFKAPEDNRWVFGFNLTPDNCKRHMPARFCANAKQNSDVLIIYHIPQVIYHPAAIIEKTDDFLKVAHNHPSITQDSIVLLSDHLRGDIFIVNDVHQSTLFFQMGKNNALTLSKDYGLDAELTELKTVAYYLGKPDRGTDTAETSRQTYSLFRSDFQKKAEEIATGITAFFVEYGIQTSTNGFQYVMANQLQPSEWLAVQQIRLKMVTHEKVGESRESKEKIWEFVLSPRNGICSHLDVNDFKHAILVNDSSFFSNHTHN